ncbi:hypothetical protein NVV95_01510 [Herbiconiux sp. CPCC 205716]|uniref:Transmembrane protein n=1 Tax=Herbiconiux gentiana TaxID=2970912 RepID=A0ABT2GC55_9MICO|nr:hypothetical protein [Herbiconiux gentiana]MCS5713222.1 hypothetical protein [Herbiconiux gentiana]
MTHRTRSLLIALRVAYGACAGAFVLAVVVAFSAAVTTVTNDAEGGFSISFDVPDDSPALIPVYWLALAAFAFAAAGALLTVFARVSSPTYSLDDH